MLVIIIFVIIIIIITIIICPEVERVLRKRNKSEWAILEWPVSNWLLLLFMQRICYMEQFALRPIWN